MPNIDKLPISDEAKAALRELQSVLKDKHAYWDAETNGGEDEPECWSAYDEVIADWNEDIAEAAEKLASALTES